MEDIVRFSKVSCSYGKECILDGIDLSVPEGIIQVVIGPSGAGKTSFIKLINGILRPGKGNISVMGCPCSRRRSSTKDKKIGYIPQHLGLVSSMTVQDNILMGSLPRIGTMRSLLKLFPEEEIESAKELMRMTDMIRKRNKKVNELSGGERRRVAISRAFMQRPKLLLADEMLSDLDFVLVRQITKQLKRLRDEFGTTIIMVEHDMKIARSIGDRILVLRDGKSQGVYTAHEMTDDILHKHFIGS